MAETQKGKSTRRFRFTSLIVLLLVVGAFWQRQFIYDEYKLRTFTPTAEVSQLATEATMTDGAKRIYFVNQPEQKQKANFADFCPNSSAETAVLGCYLSGQQGIYLLEVTNSELQGIEQVTAAHEMLHAAYDRLPSKEKKRINQALRDFYQKYPDNKVVQDTLKSYKKSSQTELINEMHSIFGTQISDLPAVLNDYYSQYFVDRRKLVTYYEKYEQAFTSRQQRIDSYDAELNSIKLSLDSVEKTAEAQKAELDTRLKQLEQYERGNQVDAYNSSVNSYNALVQAYNANINRIQSLVDQYNKLVADRNAIAFEERRLVESISTPARAQ